MENTVMNNEVMNTVTETIAIEDINKTNIVDAVKYLASSCANTFRMINSNEAGFREELDELNEAVGDIQALNESVAKLNKNMKLVGGSMIGLGIGMALVPVYLYLSNKKNKETPVVINAEIVEDGEINE